jgi:hypothetical protein
MDYFTFYPKVTGCQGVAWTPVAQDMRQWRALAIMALNFRVQQKAKDFFTTSEILSFHERPYSMESVTCICSVHIRLLGYCR